MVDFSKESLSLHFGLQEGRRADLEVVSLAAIEWANAVRVAATMLDPNLKIRIELVNAHEGSLSLNTILEWAEEKLEQLDPSKLKHPRLIKLALGLAIFLALDAGPHIDYWLGDEYKVELSEDDRRRLDELLEIISKSQELKSTNQKFFGTLNNDPAISSVGLAEKPNGKLAFNVPSEQFAERSGLWDQSEEILERTSERQSHVILETPNLSEAERLWRFKDIATDLSFTAKMKDEVFVQSLREGKISENLRIGIKMKVQVKFQERLTDGEWHPISSTIEVIRVVLD